MDCFGTRLNERVILVPALFFDVVGGLLPNEEML